MISATSGPWAWTQSSRSTPTFQCITFYSLLVFEEIVVLKIYLVKHPKSMTRITFEFTRIRKSIGSTHRDIFTKLYNTMTGATGTRLKAKGWRYRVDDTIRQRHFVSGESHQWFKIWRSCWIAIHQKIRWSAKDLMWISVLNQKKGCKGIGLWKHMNMPKLEYEGFTIFKIEDQK